MSEKPCGAYFFAFFENFFVPILTLGGLAAVSSSAFAALYSAFGKYDVVHIHAEGPAFFAWLPKMFGKRVVVTVHGIDWQREKWQSGLGSKFIHQVVIYRPEVIECLNEMLDYWNELAIQEGFEGLTYAYQNIDFDLKADKDDSRFKYNIELVILECSAVISPRKP